MTIDPAIIVIALLAFFSGRILERRNWVSKARKESDYKWLI